MKQEEFNLHPKSQTKKEEKKATFQKQPKRPPILHNLNFQIMKKPKTEKIDGYDIIANQDTKVIEGNQAGNKSKATRSLQHRFIINIKLHNNCL